MAPIDIDQQNPLALCRDCFSEIPWSGVEAERPQRCGRCRSPRILAHSELQSLSIAHIDCDAFYAAVEKRDNPDLATKPVIIGGGRRGVVATACYIARIHGVHSAMPMFKALKACPEAVVIRPNMAKYSEVGKQVRALMQEVTPLVEPISIDEAFLDLTGTERLHKQIPAVTLLKLCKKIENDIGITVSVGLSHNKFLAKLSSDFDKPKGFSVIGREETVALLSELPLSKIWGVGKQFDKKLKRDGLHTVGQIQAMDETELMKRYGDLGRRLHRLSHGQDARQVETSSKVKSISSETTFAHDISDKDTLHYTLWPLCEKIAFRMKSKELEGRVVTLKLKSKDFKTKTRRKTLSQPSQLAEVLYQEGCDLLDKEVDGTSFRLIGIGYSDLAPEDKTPTPDLFDTSREQMRVTEQAMDKVRAKFGSDAILKGRSLSNKKGQKSVQKT